MKQIDGSETGPGTSFCAELFKYNKVHRLIGNVSCETLVKESSSALNNSQKQLNNHSVLVDIGAGAGVLGYAWLKSNLSRRVIFLEPDRKAAAFLHLYFSKETRARVIQKRFEDLKLEELLSFEPIQDKIVLASRAFSSNLSLEDAYKTSGLTLPLYSFHRSDTGFSMEKINK